MPVAFQVTSCGQLAQDAQHGARPILVSAYRVRRSSFQALQSELWFQRVLCEIPGYR